MERRAALIGCRSGQWIRTSGSKLRLNARISVDTMLKIEQVDGDSIDVVRSHVLVGPGHHELQPASWTRVSVVDGSYIDALCLLEAS